MLENFKDNVLNRLHKALQTQDRADIEILLQHCDVTELLSQDTISLARKNQQKSTVIFLCSLAIDNGIDVDRAEFWLNIYQAINKKNINHYIESLNSQNIVKPILEDIINKNNFNMLRLNYFKYDLDELMDAIEILMDNNQKNKAIKMLNIVNKKNIDDKQWQNNLEKLYGRYPDLLQSISLKAFNYKSIKENSMPFFEIIISGINLNKHLDRCIESIKLQSYQDYRVHILSDDDPTSKVGDSLKIKEKYSLKNNPVVYCSKNRKGKADIIYSHFQNYSFEENSIALILDGDDMLYRKSALDTIAKTYIKETPDVCLSTYLRSDNILGHSSPLIKGYHHRQQGWRSSHCFTFKAKLLQTVPRDYICNSDGTAVMQACDIALALPILDISQKNSFIPEALYFYEVSNPQSHHNQSDGVGLSSKRQIETANYLFAKIPLKITNHQ